MMFHVMAMILAGMEGARIESMVFRFSDRTAVVGTSSEDDARAVAQAVGIELRVTSNAGSQWLTGVGTINGYGVVVTGPIKKRLEVMP